MAYTISDVQATYADSLRLVAGGGGLARPVREVGILDYELLPEVKQRFQRVNFYEGQLVLSTFLYAKDDPYLITEAVKFLVSKGSSGLVIKNVFHLQVPDGAIRYANARNFPLFLTTGDAFLFDEVITTVDRAITLLDSVSRTQRELDQLLLDRDDPALCKAHARALNPSLRDEHMALYVGFEDSDDETLSAEQRFSALEQNLAKTALGAYTNLFALFEEGALLVVSGERMVGDGGSGATDALVDILCSDVLVGQQASAIGLSEAHYNLGELADAVTEAMQAARLAPQLGRLVVRHADLGSYRLILPFLDAPVLTAFVRTVLEPLRSYDAENNAHLMQTLEAYCDNQQSFMRTAEATGQHENTIRRRLDRIAAVSGLSYRIPDEMEQLSLARKIELCREVME